MATATAKLRSWSRGTESGDLEDLSSNTVVKELYQKEESCDMLLLLLLFTSKSAGHFYKQCSCLWDILTYS